MICISYLFHLISCLSSHLKLFIHLDGLKYVSVNHGRLYDVRKPAMKIKDTYNSANLKKNK